MRLARRLLVLSFLAALGCGGSSGPAERIDLKVPPTPPAGRDKDSGGKRGIIGHPPDPGR